MNDKQKYQRRQLNKKIHAAMLYADNLDRQAQDLHQRYLDTLAQIDDAQKQICLLEDKQENFFRRAFRKS